MESGFFLYDWSGYVNEMGDAIDTRLVGLSRLMTFLATLRLVRVCVLFHFLPFVMNLFVTRRFYIFLSSVAGSLVCASASAC